MIDIEGLIVKFRLNGSFSSLGVLKKIITLSPKSKSLFSRTYMKECTYMQQS